MTDKHDMHESYIDQVIETFATKFERACMDFGMSKAESDRYLEVKSQLERLRAKLFEYDSNTYQVLAHIKKIEEEEKLLEKKYPKLKNSFQQMIIPAITWTNKQHKFKKKSD